MGGNTTKTTENKETAPWTGQQPYLTQAFSEAQDIYNTQKNQNTQAYNGDFYAKPTQQMTSAFQNALGWGSGTGTQAANTAASTGAANSMMGTQGTSGALAGLFGSAGQNATQNNINAASAYANNPTMDGMVDAAMRDSKRQLNEQDLPNLQRNAAATGNVNSTRTAISQGVLERGLADKTADVSANLRGQAYQNGLSLAQGDTAAKNAALAAAGGLAGGATSAGTSALGQAADINKTNTDNALTSTTMLNGFDQQVIDNELAKYNYQQQLPWQNLNNFYGIVGSNNWGSKTTGTSTQTQTPSTISSLGMGLGVLGSLFKCDIRVKTDIHRVSTLSDGIPLYTFRYINDPLGVLHTAPMAQDVEAKYPEAVIEIDGVKHIDVTKYDWR